jgi:tetratricopeptide (TPR) repeat protein
VWNFGGQAPGVVSGRFYPAVVRWHAGFYFFASLSGKLGQLSIGQEAIPAFPVRYNRQRKTPTLSCIQKTTLLLLMSDEQELPISMMNDGMPAVPQELAGDLLASAVALHRAGRFIEAEAGYRRILSVDMSHADAIHLLGVIAVQRGDPVEAEALIRKALAYREDAVFLGNLGSLLCETGRLAEAEAALRRALELNSGYAEAYFNLGNLLHDTDRLAEAENAFCRALELNPDFAKAHNNLGNLFNGTRRFAEAESALLRALKLNPDFPEAHYNLGNLFYVTRRPVEAEAAYCRVLELDPDFAKAHGNLGKLFYEARRFPEAESAYRRALELKPDYAEALFGLGLLLLALGRYAEAWPYYELRYSPEREKQEFVLPDLPYPQWRGESLSNKSLLLYPEQGFGDQIQFARYASMLKQCGASRLTLVCTPAIKSLLETVDGIDAVVTETESLPAHDYWSFVMSLPLHLGTTLDTIPGRLPYLRAAAERVAAWLPRLPSRKLKVGLVWSGNPRVGNFNANAVDQRRSMHIGHFLPLLQLPGIAFVSLQKDEAARAQLEELPPDLRPLDLMGAVQDFGDTAAIIQNLDLVITVDTAIAHLAGALNKPVWVLSRFDGCWRWLEERDDSPWYPGVLRLFRQPVAGDWATPIARVREDLLRMR